MNGTILANRSAVDRSHTDFYETPEEVTNALLDFLESTGDLLPGRSVIWEPACGAGRMAKVIISRGYNTRYSDLYDKSFGYAPVDFLTAAWDCDWIITNPPFNRAGAFISHALELKKPCAFLVKSQFWHARSRLAMFRENPPSYVLPLTWRPDFLFGQKSGSPTMDCIWTVWAGSHEARYIPLERPTEGGGRHAG